MLESIVYSRIVSVEVAAKLPPLLVLTYTYCLQYNNRASALDFEQCGMCDQQSLRSACAYAQSDQSLC